MSKVAIEYDFNYLLVSMVRVIKETFAIYLEPSTI
jgi:hypothetical protein